MSNGASDRAQDEDRAWRAMTLTGFNYRSAV